jgi:high-affinity iron transporter
MLANYLIGLREGLEAALVVSILVACLVRTGRGHAVRWVWTGVGVAVALSVAVGALLEFTSASLSFTAAELFGGVMSIIAVVFVTWMIFWMRSASRGIARELRGQMDRAMEAGVGAVVLMSFIAARAAGSTVAPLLGFSVGLGTAVVLGWLLYRSAITINLSSFFRWTGLLLIFVAAGVLSYGIHDLQEAGVLPGLNTLAFDVSETIPPTSWYGTLLKGIFNFSPRTSVLEAVAWVCYVSVTLLLYLRPARVPSRESMPVAA